MHALLERGDDVVVFDSGLAAGFGYLEGSRAAIVTADMRDTPALERALEGCGAVVHLAAQASVPQSIADPLGDLEINVRASLSLLDKARQGGVTKFVFASSNAVIGGHPPPAHEDLVPYPVSPYGAAKAAMEAYLRAYYEAFGVEGIALRFANAYGPRSAHKSSVVASFVKAYLTGGPIIINGTGDQTRDFVHVTDVSSTVLTCLDAPGAQVAGEIFQVGTGHETSLLELAQLLFEVGGAEVPLGHRPPSFGDVARNVSDITKARTTLGYVPRVALRDGLADTIQWFRENWHA